MKRVNVKTLSFTFLLFSLFAVPNFGHSVEDETKEFAHQILKSSANAEWENLDEVRSWLCPSIKKGMSQPRVLNGWKLGGRYGAITTIEETTAEAGYSETMRTDVKVRTKNSPYKVLYRFWIKREQERTCLYAFNFAELPHEQ